MMWKVLKASFRMRNGIYLLGCYLAAKWGYQTLSGLCTALKTYALPLVWKRDFQKEYGDWAVVTGCTRGIGYYYAFELAKRGMNLVLIARNAKVLNEMAQEMRDKHNIKVQVVQADFNEDVYDRIHQALLNKDIGILVNNVGLFYPALLHFNDLETNFIKTLLSTNITTVTLMCKLVLPMMEKKKKGAIVNIASVQALSIFPLFTVYCASKAYVDVLSRGMAAEYKDKGITIQSLCPGGVDTEMLAFFPKDKAPKLFIPPPDIYAASAIRTLGFSPFTCGYWPHSLQAMFLKSLTPNQMYKMHLKILNEVKNTN